MTEAIEAANQKLAQLNDPTGSARERERRAEAAEKRLGGLTAAQQRFPRRAGWRWKVWESEPDAKRADIRRWVFC